MQKAAAVVVVVAVFLVLSAGPAGGDIVYLQNGKVYRGKVTREGEKVLIAGPLATISVDAKDVLKIIESKAPAKPKPEDIPAVPTLPLAVPKTGPEAYTRPEPHVFLLMQQKAGTPAGAMSLEIDQLIKSWQMKAHDRLRKYRNRWISPDDVRRARGEFAETLKKAQPLLVEIRRAGSTTTSGRAAQARYRRSLATYFRQAAAVWPDQVMQDFLMGAANLEGLNYNGALEDFRRCEAAAPRVAAFRQGKALALAGKDRHIEALAATVELLHLMPDSRDAYALVADAMENTPGAKTADPTYRTAESILDLYEAPPRRSYSRPGVTWLMPGRPWMGREFALPTPPYDRLVFRQAVGVPVGPHALIVDRGVLDGAHEAFVRIDGKTVVPAKIERIGTYGVSKEAQALGMVTVADFTFTPLKTEAVALAKGQVVEAYGLGVYEEMGTVIRPIQATVSQGPGSEAGLKLTHWLLPGEGLGPLVAKGERLAGFLGPKTDAMADGGGPDRFIPIAEAAMHIRRATRTTSIFGGYGRIKRKITPKPAAGRVFVVHVTASEGDKTRRY